MKVSESMSFSTVKISIVKSRHALGLAMCLLAVCLVASSAQAQATGSLSGRFVFQGDVPERVEIVPTKDQTAFKQKIWDESLVVSEDRGIANIVIYVSSRDVPVPDALPEGMPEKVTMNNKNGAFVPHVVPFWMGKQEFVATNTDTVAHNCNCASIGDRTGTFNQQLTPGQEYAATFTRAQRTLQPVSCNIHPWMKGYVLPRSNPFFAVTDENGEFTIENLPPGEWQFQVVHEKAGYLAIGDWERGRFTMKIKAGDNSIGEVNVPADIFEK